jgi:hypothetical protein
VPFTGKQNLCLFFHDELYDLPVNFVICNTLEFVTLSYRNTHAFLCVTVSHIGICHTQTRIYSYRKIHTLLHVTHRLGYAITEMCTLSHHRICQIRKYCYRTIHCLLPVTLCSLPHSEYYTQLQKYSHFFYLSCIRICHTKIRIHSFCTLSYDRSIPFSKVSYIHNAI